MSASLTAPPAQPPARDPGRMGGLREGFRALRHRNYRLFWTGQLVSVSGTWMSTLALSYLVAYELDASPFQLSLVGAFQFGPILVLGLVGGVIADRFPKRAILMLTQALAALLAVALTILVGADLVQLWHVYAVALGLGLVNAVDMPSRQAFVSELVPPDDLMNAIALNATIFNAGRVVGPALAGVLLATFGAAFCFGINAVTFLPLIAGLAMMRFPPRRRETVGGSNLERLREGLGYVRATPAVWLLVILVGFVGTFGMNFNLWVPLLAKNEFSTGGAGLGILMASLGVGSLTGALTLAFGGKKPRQRLMLTTAVLLGVLELSVAAVGAARVHFLVAAPLLAGMGFSMSTTMASANTTIQSTAPAALRGRVMSVYATVFAGTVPIGSLILGSVAQAWGTPASLIAGGGVTIAAALTVIVLSRTLAARPAAASTKAPPAPKAVRPASSAAGAISTGRSLAARREE